MQKTIVVTVGPAGDITVQTHGYTGPACKDASRFIEDAIGRKTAEQLTPEYHRSESATKTRTRQGH